MCKQPARNVPGTLGVEGNVIRNRTHAGHAPLLDVFIVGFMVLPVSISPEGNLAMNGISVTSPDSFSPRDTFYCY